MRVVVTGASGYIGRYLSPALVDAGAEVVALSRAGASPGAFRCTMSARVGTLAEHMEGVDHVIHLAGRLVDDPRAGIVDYYAANVLLTHEVVAASVRAGATSFVHASSRLLYPRTLQAPAVEDRDAAPDTPYGISKGWAEDVVRFAAGESGLNAISLRIGQVTGRDHPGLGVINSFVAQARSCGKVTVQGAGDAVREVVHVDDVVAALIAAMDHQGPWLPVNVGGTRSFTIRELADLVAERTSGKVEVVHAAVTQEDTSCYALSHDRARRTLRWAPQWSPEDIVQTLYAPEETP